MLKLTPLQIGLIAALAVSLLVSAVRVSRMAKQYGRNPRRWFFITLFLTAIPATIVFWRDHLRRISARNFLPSSRRRGSDLSDVEPAGEGPRPGGGVRRCPHCGGVLETTSESAVEAPNTCSNCHMTIEEGFFA